MKKGILIVTLIVSSYTGLFSQEADYDKIERVLNYFIEGDLINDYETIKKGFHNSATLKTVSSKTRSYRAYNALEVFKNGEKRATPKPNIISRIEDIDVSNSAAAAKIVVTTPNVVVTDYIHLLKIEGRWKIVSKAYSVTVNEKKQS